MKAWEAQATLIYVNKHYAGRIAAAIDSSKVQSNGSGYSIFLLLIPGQRCIMSPFVESIKSILGAWEAAFFPEREEGKRHA